jgi:hypothetical protein
MEKVETIKDRMSELHKKYPNTEDISIMTEIIDLEDAVRAKASIFYKGTLLATGHSEKWFDSDVREEATPWAETRAVSRAIGFLLRKEVIHTEEDLMQLSRRRLKSFYAYAKDGATLEELKTLVDDEDIDFVKRKLQSAFNSITAKIQMDEARNKNNK